MSMHTPKFPDDGHVFTEEGKTTVVVPTEKRIRALVGGKTICDSRRAMILRSGYIPSYCFPEDDVDFSLLDPAGKTEAGMEYALKGKAAGGKERAIRYGDGYYNGVLEGYLNIPWNMADRWMEEDEEVRIHPRDPYTRIDVRQGSQRVEVKAGGVLIASTGRPLLLFETGLPVRYYIPPEDVDMSFLRPSQHSTGCPYKGVASYWDISAGGAAVKDAVWSYLEPYDEVQRVRGYFCFYGDRMDSITVDGKKLTE